MTCYANIDAVTTIGIDDGCVEDVLVNYHWMPPWVIRPIEEDTPQMKCKEQDHQISALQDFLHHTPCKVDQAFVNLSIPKQRYDRVRNVVASLNHYADGRNVVVRIPKRDAISLCESTKSTTCRMHALAYINTVLDVKGLNAYKKDDHQLVDHIEIKDRGPSLSGASFRRLRRLITSCAVKNSYIPKVHRIRDGRPLVKRRLRLKLHSSIARCVDVKEKVRDLAEFYCIMGTLPTYRQHAVLIPIISGHSLPVTWYKVTLSKGCSIATEGVMLKLVMK